jgi:transcriptional regulator with GAF, ATPase, and Fis domain
VTAEQRERDIIQSFIRFTDRLVDDFDVLDLTIQLTEDCARLLDVDAAGLLLADSGGILHLLAATSEHARSLEVFQLQRVEGPCLDSYLTGVPVSVPDLTVEVERWPQFVPTAVDEGFASVHAIPLRLREEVLGALGLFGTSPGTLDADDLTLAQALAHVASIAIVQQDQTATRDSLLPNLQSAVASRGMLEMAKGVLAEAFAIDMDEAFARLRGLAHERGQRLSEVARRVVLGDANVRGALLTDLSARPTPAEPRS